MSSKPNEQTLLDKYITLWNERMTSLQLDFDSDKVEFAKDEHIGFKWTHLIQQEINMWISLCCNDTIEYDQVPLDDFKFIINRRGFTPRIVSNLKTILIDIGIGNELKEYNMNTENEQETTDDTDSARYKSIDMVQSETTNNAMRESGLVRHARTELELAGMFDKDSDYNGMIGNAVMELIKVFAEQGHSGHSAGTVNSLFNKLASCKTICPLTGEDSEWNNVGGIGTNGNDSNMFQNNRNSEVFKNGKDGKAYYIDAVIWRTQKGMTYTGKTEEGISSRQFIKSFPFTPKTFYIDVIEEVKKDDWIFRIKNVIDMNKVWEVYDSPIEYKEKI